MIELLVGMACFVAVFSVTSAGTVMQVAALACFAGAAGYALLMNRVSPVRISLSEFVLYLLGVAYVVLSIFGEADAMPLAVAFLLTIVAISIIVRALTLAQLLDIGAVVSVLSVATVVALDRSQAMTALSSGGGEGLLRFMPLGMTPNLVGYVFGACCVLLVRRAIVTRRWSERLVMAGSAFACCIFVLAASARSSLIGLAVAGAVGVFLEYGFKRTLSLTSVRIGILAVVVVCVAFAERVGMFFTRMLELDSSTRGISTGGSGRTELWARGVDTLFSDPKLFIFGGGFRSSNSDLIGFSTESSYISILLDSGAFLGVATIAIFLYAPIKALQITPPQERHASTLILAAAFMTFILVESIFNRYLLAIGNPASLLSLLVLVSLSLQQRASVPAAVPSFRLPAIK
jgi:exopolysaccharide production protein ExoQ